MLMSYKTKTEAHKVLLINPYFLTKRYRYAKSTYHYYPTGLVYVASNLSKDKYKVRILDLFVERLSRKRFINTVKDFAPDYVGISAYTENIVSAFEITDLLKSINDRVKIILGGPHVSALPERTLREKRNIDFIMAGEGERSFAELLDSLANGSPTENISGVYCRNFNEKGEKKKNIPAYDLDSLRFPDWGLVGCKKYASLINFKNHIVDLPLITQRGCPYKCTFCYDLHGKRIRQRSIENILDEIELNMAKYKAKSFTILDEVFTFDRERTMEFCRKIKEKGLNKHLSLGCSTRTDLLDKEMIETMKEAGFNRIMLGIESSSETTLERMKKGIRLDGIRNIIGQLKSKGIITHISVIIGYPLETKKDIRETMAFARRLRPDYLSINILFPYPGTEILREALEKGRTLDEFPWLKFSRDITVPINLKDIRDCDLKRYRSFGYLLFYSNIFRLIKLIRTFGIKKIIKGMLSG